ncbi:hypothetical protein BED46_018655 [Burkholderia contaminans]|uniref:Uncharacterized protein n=1 Tax=Burkholderia contaminans LMG 23361 TaxID=1334628 RepID=A0ABD4AXT3_9BURK|nr:hypothetical protein WR31_09490 [Burkholderia contaminans LMG 23361]MBA9829056.1 hypothetical protein [Burkholderia contaminans]MBA9838047.1 hypothetical protein [Burkholderia contaminans]MBA9862474.1 hypothetical protein [Burkholderia contaminans]MBA9908730.1 hypothetical protein [Burkholderia contaminans]
MSLSKLPPHTDDCRDSSVNVPAGAIIEKDLPASLSKEGALNSFVPGMLYVWFSLGFQMKMSGMMLS